MDDEDDVIEKKKKKMNVVTGAARFSLDCKPASAKSGRINSTRIDCILKMISIP